MSTGDQPAWLLEFLLEEDRYALRLSVVERVVPAVAITPLPGAPAVVAGVINVQGRVIPVFDIRLRFRHPARELRASDQFILAGAAGRSVAVAVDRVLAAGAHPADSLTLADDVVPGLEYVAGIVKLADGLIVIHDLDAFLSSAERDSLDQALGRGEGARDTVDS